MANATINLVTTVGPIQGSGDVSFPDGLTLPAGTTLDGVGLLTQNTASMANIAAILDAGVNGLVAAIGNTQYTMKVTSNSAIFSDSRAVYNGTSTAAVTAGVYTPAVAINAVGIGMGANRPSDGAWENTVFINASTGAATFLGTVTAGSVISGTVQMGSSLTAVDTVVSGASDGTTALSTKLNKNAADVLGGNITFTTNGAFQIGTATWDGSSATGTGVMYNQYGIVAVNSGTIEFVLNGSTGSATFAGALNAATGSFAGNVSTSGSVLATGNVSSGGGQGAVLGVGTRVGVGGVTTGSGQAGVAGQSNNTGSPGVLAVSSGTSATNHGLDVIGYQTINGQINSSVATGTAPFTVSSTTVVTNLNSQYWGGVRFNATTTGTATATFSSTNKPGSNSTNVWLPLTNTSGTVIGYLPYWT